MNNIVELRTSLCDVFAALKAGTLDPKTARSLVGAAREIIDSCKVELEYAHLCRVKPSVEFLDAN